ncbi:hypothetical protein [Rhodopseudomonas palustris]|uniref:hypothetical protein n=1 Tax=Rhodopseudomonas palustris TaxID=1076 RepID=UPI00031D0990
MAKAAIFVAVWLGCIAAGYVVPMQHGNDVVTSALAAAALMIIGAGVGPYLALAIVRRIFN